MLSFRLICVWGVWGGCQGDGALGGCPWQGKAKHWAAAPGRSGRLTQAWELSLPILSWALPGLVGNHRHIGAVGPASMLSLCCAPSRTPHPVNTYRLYSLQTFSGRLFGIMPKSRGLGLISGFDICKLYKRTSCPRHFPSLNLSFLSLGGLLMVPALQDCGERALMRR